MVTENVATIAGNHPPFVLVTDGNLVVVRLWPILVGRRCDRIESSKIDDNRVFADVSIGVQTRGCSTSSGRTPTSMISETIHHASGGRSVPIVVKDYHQFTVHRQYRSSCFLCMPHP